MKVALVHDFLLEYGGAERVVEVLHELWPEAPVYTAFVDAKGLGPHWERLKTWDLHCGWGQHIPGLRKFQSPFRFLAPFYFKHFDLSKYDVVISSTNAYFAKSVRIPNGVHICYCHTPARALYGYPTRTDWRRHWLTRIYGTVVNHFLRIEDWYAARQVDYFVANSKEVARRIKKFYRRESVVIYPPVELVQVKAGRVPCDLTKGTYYLYVGKLAVAKHVKLAISACRKLGEKLVVVGNGKERSELERRGKLTARFLGNVSDRTLAGLYTGCRAVIFPSEDEDFGIVPVEAMAFGKPVIAHRSGGVVETVVDGLTGVLFDELTVDGLVSAVQKLGRLRISAEACRKQAEKFSKERFNKEMKEFVAKCLLSKNF